MSKSVGPTPATEQTSQQNGMTLGQSVVQESFMRSNPQTKIIKYIANLGQFDPQDEEARIHGKANPPRSIEPDMKTILQWDFDDYPNDYTKIRGGEKILKNRIRKSGEAETQQLEKYRVSESHDNYREHLYSPEKKRYYFDYLETSDEKLKEKRQRDREAKLRENQAYRTVYQVEYDRVIEAAKASRVGCEGGYGDGNQDDQDDYNREGEMDETGERMEGSQMEETTKDGTRMTEARMTEEEGKKSSGAGGRNKKRKVKEQKYANQEIAQLSRVTRWLPSTSFATYFGKPPFHPYGNGNTNPTNGGTVYGSYMMTHNIGPQEGGNNPHYQQVYDSALVQGQQRPPRKCELPRKPLYPMGEPKATQEEECIKRNPIMPRKNGGSVRVLNGPKKQEIKGKKKKEESQKTQETRPQTGTSPSGKRDPSRTTNGKLRSQEVISPVSEQEMSQGRAGPEKQQTIHWEEEGDTKEADEYSEPRQYDKLRMEPPTPPPRKDSPDISPNSQLFPPAIKDNALMYFQPLPLGDQNTLSMHELDPKNYKFVPPQWTQRIPAAGKGTHHSEALSTLLK